MKDWIEAIVGAFCLFGAFYISLVIVGVLA